MPNKKKKPARPRKSAGNKRKAVKKTAAKKLAKKKAPLKKVSAPRTAASKRKTRATRSASLTRSGTSRKRSARDSQIWETDAVDQEARRSRSAGQSGDLQGLSEVERADSESVEELLEEGNAFEADAVAGVEHAADADESEVHTHQVPEDDVPEEYLDQEDRE